jgi:hypothetical protein
MKSLILLCASLITVSLAFTVSCPQQQCASQSRTTSSAATCALNLTPNQGSQLVDAYNNNAAHSHANMDDDDDDFVAVGLHTNQEKPLAAATTTTTTTGGVGIVSSTARALLHRLGRISTHHHDAASDHDNDDDVVYYPVIGFTYVPDAKDHSRALPTVSNPSCRLIYEKLLDKQAVYGEWTKRPQQQQQQTPPPPSDEAADAAAATAAEERAEQESYHLQ